MQIHCNKRTFSHKNNVQSPKDWLGTPAWPPFYCFRTPLWWTWHHVKMLQWFARMHNTVVVIGTRQDAMIDTTILRIKLGIPESGKFLPVESAIRDIFAYGIWNSSNYNVWNPESKFHWQRLESSTWNPESTAWVPESKTVLYSFTSGKFSRNYLHWKSFRRSRSHLNLPRYLAPWCRV